MRVFGDKWVFVEYCQGIMDRFCNPDEDIFNIRLGCLVATELVLRNVEMVYDDETFVFMVRGCVNMLSQYPQFAEYLKHFRRKADKRYRKERQAVYVEKILEASKLDGGSISNILVYL